MSVVRSLQPDAVVRPSAIVEDNEALYLFQSLLIRLKTPVLTVYALALDRAVQNTRGQERCACETTKFFSNFFRKICKFLSFLRTAISDTWKFWLAARQQ